MPWSMNELISNAVEHGFAGRVEGNIEIRFCEMDSSMVIESWTMASACLRTSIHRLRSRSDCRSSRPLCAMTCADSSN